MQNGSSARKAFLTENQNFENINCSFKLNVLMSSYRRTMIILLLRKLLKTVPSSFLKFQIFIIFNFKKICFTFVKMRSEHHRKALSTENQNF